MKLAVTPGITPAHHNSTPNPCKTPQKFGPVIICTRAKNTNPKKEAPTFFK